MCYDSYVFMGNSSLTGCGLNDPTQVSYFAKTQLLVQIHKRQQQQQQSKAKPETKSPTWCRALSRRGSLTPFGVN